MENDFLNVSGVAGSTSGQMNNDDYNALKTLNEKPDTFNPDAGQKLTENINETIVDEIAAEREQAIISGIISDAEANPIQFGKAKQIAKSLNVDADVVYNNMPAFEAQAKEKKIRNIINNHPNIRKMAVDRDFVKYANMDFDKLAEIERNIHIFGQETEQKGVMGWFKKAGYSYSSNENRLGAYEEAYDLMNDLDLSDNVNLDYIREKKRELDAIPVLDTSGWGTDLALNFMEQLPYQKRTTAYVAGGAAVGGAIGGTVSSLAAIPTGGTSTVAGGAVGAKIGTAAGMGVAFNNARKVEAGGMFYDLIDVKDKDGNYLNAQDCKEVAELYGVLSASIELIPAGAMAKMIPGVKGLTKYGLKGAIKEAVKDKAKRTILLDIGKDFTKAVISEGGEEAAQELLSVFAERYLKSEANKAGASFEQNSVGNDVSRILEAGLQGTKASLMLAGMGAGARSYVEISAHNRLQDINALKRGKEAKALSDGQILDNAQKQVEQLVMIKETPENFTAFMQSATKNSIYKDMFMEAEDAKVLLQTDILRTKQKENTALAGLIEDINNQIELSEQTGQPVRIGFSDYATHVMSDINLYNAFKGIVKTYADGITLNQIKNRQTQIQNFIDEGKKIRERRENDFEVAYNTILENLVVGEMPAQQRTGVAEMNAYFLLTLSERAGVPVQELLAKNAPQYNRSFDGSISGGAKTQEIIDTIRQEQLENEEQNLIEKSRMVAKRNINAIKKALSARINDPSTADARSYLRLVNAISDMKMNIAGMSNDDIINNLSEYTKSGTLTVDIKRDNADRVKSGIFSASETALANIQGDKANDYVLVAGGRVPVNYEVVELASIQTSHSPDGKVNPNFPTELQPRDRQRGSSEAQINEIVSKFAPERVSKNVMANEGAPIVTPDGFVAVGNGRAMAINRMYENGGKAEQYKGYLTEQGFDVSGFEKPVLVRRVALDLSGAEMAALVDAANTSGTMVYSDSENAIRDAAKLTGNILDVLDVEAELDSAANRRFVSAFFGEVIPTAERNAYLDKDSKVTKKGIERVENALVGMIIPDARFLSVLVENPDNNIRKVTSGLAKAAPAIIGLENEIQAGRVNPAYSILTDTQKAVAVLKRAKDKNVPVEDYINMIDMFEEPITAETKAIVKMFVESPSANAFANNVKTYIRHAMEESALESGNLLGIEPKSKLQLLDMTEYHQFAGVNAANYNEEALGRAISMLATGADNEEVRQQTGWFMGKDKLLRYEISDADTELLVDGLEKADVRNRLLNENEQLLDDINAFKKELANNKDAYPENYIENLIEERWKRIEAINYELSHMDEADYHVHLSDVLRHDKLFAAYPEFKGITVKVSDWGNTKRGQFDGQTITLNRYAVSEDGLKSTLLHEIQHAIQMKEGFSVGGSKDTLKRIHESIKRELNKAFERTKKASFKKIVEKELGADVSGSLFKVINSAASDEYMLKAKAFLTENGVPSDTQKRIFSEIISDKEAEAIAKDVLKGTKYDPEPLERFLADFAASEDAGKWDIESVAYLALAGEVEARNTQHRMNMTDAERKATPPEETAGINPDRILVVWPDGSLSFSEALDEVHQKAKTDINTPEFKAWNGKNEVIPASEAWEHDFKTGEPVTIEAYHGTNRKFNTFDKKQIGSATDSGFFGSGFYFTNSTGEAGYYGDIVMPVYIKFNNPLNITDAGGGSLWGLYDNMFETGANLLDEFGLLDKEEKKTLEEYKKRKKEFFDKVKPYITTTMDATGNEIKIWAAEIERNGETYYTRSYDAQNYTGVQEQLSTPENAMNNLWNRYYHENDDLIKYFGFTDYIRENGLSEAFSQKVKERGYDGIIAGDEYVVFEPNQIKSVYNRGTWSKKSDNIYYQSAFAGSRVDYDKPSLEAIGTGEGAQVHGWGLYYALKKEVAERYKDNYELEETISYDGEFIIDKHETDADVLLDLATGKINKAQAIKRYKDIIKEIGRNEDTDFRLNRIKGIDITKFKQEKPQVHEVDLPEMPYLLDEQKTFNEQSKYVKEVIKNMPTEYFEDIEIEESTGEDIYGELVNHINQKTGYKLSQKEAEKQASQLLEQYGIKGITYDGRQDGRCFVIFNPKDIKVIQKFYQGVGTENYGAFAPSTNTITLFRNANLSTIIHETGHYWLTMLERYATLPNASAGLKADYEVLTEWLNAEKDRQYTITQEADGSFKAESINRGEVLTAGTSELIEEKCRQEVFARGIEKYFRTAEAPSFKIRDVFGKFKGWLKGIYTQADELDVEMTDEVREIFDRMFASEAEITEFAFTNNLKGIFQSAEQAKMTPDEFEAYQQMISDSLSIAADKRYAAMASLSLKEKTDAFQKGKDRIRADMMNEWCQDRYFRALTVLLTGKIGDVEIDRIILNKKELIDTFKESGVARLPKRDDGKNFYANNGISLEMAADFFGFTEQEFKTVLSKSNKMLKQFETALNERVHEELGDPVTLPEVEKSIVSAISNEKRATLLNRELLSIGKQTGHKRTVFEKALIRYAEEAISKVTIRDLKPMFYFDLSNQAGERALVALNAGNLQEAYRQKEIQLRNFYLYKEAEKQKDVVDKLTRRLQQIGKKEVNPTIDQVYQDAARALLGRFYLSNALSQKAKERIGSLSLWIMQQRENGYDIAIPESFLTDLQQKPYVDLTVEEFLILGDAIKSIVHNGKEIKNFELNGKMIEKAELLAKFDEELKKHRKPISKSKSSRKPKKETFLKTVRSADAAITGLGHLSNEIDSGNTNGLFHSMFMRHLAAAQATEHDLQTKYAQKIVDLTRKLPKETLKSIEKYVAGTRENLGNEYTRGDLISFGLNMGNRFNLQRLQDGNRFSTIQLEWIKNNLTKEEWDYIQSIWDTIDGMYPILEEHHKRLSGLDMDKVFPQPVDTKYGRYKGGYYPIVYDKEQSASLEAKDVINKDNLFDSDYMRPSTNKGYTKKRYDVVKEPLRPGLDVIALHMNSVIHDVAYRQPLRQLWSLVNDARFVESFDTYVGKEYREQIKDLLRSVGNEPNQDARVLGVWEKTLRFFRQRATMIGLGYRLSTILTQPLGFFSSMAKLTEGQKKLKGKHNGSYWLAFGHKEIVKADVREWALANSDELRSRLGNNDATVSKRIKELQKHAGRESKREIFEAWAYKALGYADFYIAMTTWLAGYNQATQDFGMKHTDAVYYADRVMIDSQGTGNLKDSIKMQRGNELYRGLTMFYSFFSSLYQMTKQLGKDTKNVKNMNDFINVSARFVALLVLPTMMDAILRGEAPDEDDDETIAGWFALRMFEYYIASIPVLRDMYSGVKYNNNGSVNHVRGANYFYSGGSALFKVFSKMLNGDVDITNQKATKAVLNGLATATGLPVGGQIADTTGWLVGVATDEIRPQSISDILWGLYKGKERK